MKRSMKKEKVGIEYLLYYNVFYLICVFFLRFNLADDDNAEKGKLTFVSIRVYMYA